MSTEEILAAAAEAKKTPLFKRSKEQSDIIYEASKIERNLTKASGNLKMQRLYAKNEKIDVGSSEVDENDAEAMQAEADRIKTVRQEAKAQAKQAKTKSEPTKPVEPTAPAPAAPAKQEKSPGRLSAWVADFEQQQREAFPHRSDKPNSDFEGVDLSPKNGWIKYKGEKHPLPATATVESQGEMRRRVTLTRVVAVGVFALALKKKKDERDLFLTVEGDGWAFVVDVNPKKQLKARQFAAQINSA